MSRQYLREVSYVGDGVYVGHDGYQLWLFTSNGIEDSNFIAMQLGALDELSAYVKRVMRSKPQPKDADHEKS